MKILGTIQGMTQKSGTTQNRPWTRTTIELEGQKFSTIRPFNHCVGNYVRVEYEVGTYGNDIRKIERADPVAPKDPNPLPVAPPAKPAGIGLALGDAGSFNNEVLHRLLNIENYLAQFDKKYLELFQGVAERLSQEHATIQSIAGKSGKIELDLSNFLQEQDEIEAVK